MECPSCNFKWWNCPKSLENIVRPEGIEPSTHWLRVRITLFLTFTVSARVNGGYDAITLFTIDL